MSYSTLISTDALAARLDSGVVIADCRYDLADEGWGEQQYHAGHIPGAVYVSLSRHLAGPNTGVGGRHPVPSPDVLASTLSQLGIGSGAQVVAYDQETGMFASRLWWTLRYLGHDAVAVLDGGWGKWLAEKRPTRGGEETRVPARFDARPRPEQRLDLADVERLVATRSALLVDARGPERYEGHSEPIDRIAGHIPGARNHYYRNNVAADGTLLPPPALRAQFDEVLEGRPAAEIVMYCGSGVSACQNLLALEHAGLGGARLYPGSWSEWSRDPARPVETGPARRG